MEGEKNVYWLRNLTKQTSIFSWQFTEGHAQHIKLKKLYPSYEIG